MSRHGLLKTTFAFSFVLCFVSASGLYADHHEKNSEWKPLFDGESLDGWKGREDLWSVKDGAIVGSTFGKKLTGNTFLVSEKEYADFNLRFKFRFNGTGNSGLQLRSKQVQKPEDFVISGYQADIGNGYHGSLYDEKRRGMLQAADREWVKPFVQLDGKKWNQYEVRAIGNEIELAINGLVTARYTEKDDVIPRSGVLAFQLHVGPEMEIGFKDIEIQEIVPRQVLYVTHSAGFKHSSLPLSHEIFKKIGKDSGYFEVTATNDVDQITPEGLEKYDLVAFYTTGDKGKFPLSEENRQFFIDWVKDGHGFVGFHAATDTYKDWQPYYEMIGGSFDGHPWHEDVLIDIEDPTHPSVLHLDTQWKIKDEIYQFKNYDRSRLHIIMSLNPVSEAGKARREDGDVPIAWCREFGKGKVFYTSLGHREDVWTNPLYQEHVEGGVLYALGVPGYESDATPGIEKPSMEWVSLLPKSGLGEWKPINSKSDWAVEDDVLTGRGAQGHLYSPKKYKNFHYRADIKIGDNSNSGMYFRTQLPENEKVHWPNGMEAQVNSAHTDKVRTGSLYQYVKVYERLIPVDEWGTQEVIALGQWIVIKVNGRVTARGKFPYNGKKHFPDGHFAFQQHHAGSKVDIRKVQVRELSSAVD